MLTFILIFTNVYTASIMNRRSHKINNFGRNFNISFENVTKMLLGNTKKNTCFFFMFFFDNLSSALRKRGMLIAYTKLFQKNSYWVLLVKDVNDKYKLVYKNKLKS